MAAIRESIRCTVSPRNGSLDSRSERTPARATASRSDRASAGSARDHPGNRPISSPIRSSSIPKPSNKDRFATSARDSARRRSASPPSSSGGRSSASAIRRSRATGDLPLVPFDEVQVRRGDADTAGQLALSEPELAPALADAGPENRPLRPGFSLAIHAVAPFVVSIIDSYTRLQVMKLTENLFFIQSVIVILTMMAILELDWWGSLGPKWSRSVFRTQRQLEQQTGEHR